MNNENYLRKIWVDYKAGIALGSLAFAMISVMIYGFSKIPYCQESSYSYDYCIEQNISFGGMVGIGIIFFVIAFIAIYLFLIFKNFDKVKSSITNMSEENERRLKFEEKFNEKRQIKELETIKKQEEEQQEKDSSYDTWVKKINDFEKKIKSKEYITITLNDYDYSLLYIWFEDNNYNLFLSNTQKNIYEKEIFGDKNLISLKVDKLELREQQNYSSYDRNPKKSATIKGAVLAGTTGALVGASSTDKTKETVTYETNKDYYLECKTFKSTISKKDYMFLKDYIEYNKE